MEIIMSIVPASTTTPFYSSKTCFVFRTNNCLHFLPLWPHGPLGTGGPFPTLVTEMERRNILCDHTYNDVFMWRTDCSICKEGFMTSLGFKCTKCLDREWRIVIAAVVLAVGTGAMFVVVLYQVSGKTRGNGLVDGAVRLVPLNSLKILVVAWQIVTQVRLYFRTNHSAKSLCRCSFFL